MDFETLPRDALVTWQYTFGFHVEADGGCLGIRCLDDPADDLTYLTLEVLHLIRTFRFTNTLLDDLARSLRGDAPKICWSGLDNHHIAELRFRVDFPRFVQQDFGLRLLHV